MCQSIAEAWPRCPEKKGYASRAHAEKVRAIREGEEGFPLYSYLCDKCALWHLTKHPKAQFKTVACGPHQGGSMISTHVHGGGLVTESFAYAKASRGIKAMRDRILQDIVDAGDVGMTPDEWCDRNGALINTVRRRFTDLWKEGLIKHHPDAATSLNADGNHCVRWVVGTDSNAVRHISAKKALRVIREGYFQSDGKMSFQEALHTIELALGV